MAEDEKTLESIDYPSKESPDAYEAQSEIARVMYKYYQILDEKITEKLNQKHANIAKEEPKQFIDDDDIELEEIINKPRERLQDAKAILDEHYKKFESEYGSLKKVISDLRKKAALLRDISSTL
jgi:predicted nuclease with TOPRIM domain